MATATQYQYEQLREQEREIRLIELLPGNDGDPIRCKLWSTPLDKAGLFDALSYTWGDPADKATISINDKIATVTRNLEQALLHLRRPKKSYTWWIDAICINQDDVAEKSWQVQQMRMIYSAADEVIAFIGPEKDDSTLAIQLLKTIEGEGMKRLEEAAESIQTGNTLLDTKPWKAVRALFERPYWTRVWIVQELAVASKEPIVLCGHATFFLPQLWKAHKALLQKSFVGQMGKLLTALGDGFNMIPIISAIRAAVVSDEDPNSTAIDRILEYTSRFNATEGRDRVYALVGLGRAQQKATLKVDYAKSTGEVFQDAVMHIIDTDQSLDLLGMASDRVTTMSLPSWVPDFSSIRQTAGSIMTLREYNASAGSSMSVAWPTTGTLSAAGLRVDTIKAVYRPNMASRTDICIKDMQAFALRELSSQNNVDGMNSLHRGGSFWRTLVTDKDLRKLTDGSPAPSEIGDGCYILLQHWSALGKDQLLQLKGITTEEEIDAMVRPFDINFTRTFGGQAGEVGRCFFVTNNGRLGVGPLSCQAGDDVAILYGARMPFVVRDHGSGTTKLVGECYVHGIMQGEALDNHATSRRFDLT